MDHFHMPDIHLHLYPHPVLGLAPATGLDRGLSQDLG